MSEACLSAEHLRPVGYVDLLSELVNTKRRTHAGRKMNLTPYPQEYVVSVIQRAGRWIVQIHRILDGRKDFYSEMELPSVASDAADWDSFERVSGWLGKAICIDSQEIRHAVGIEAEMGRTATLDGEVAERGQVRLLDERGLPLGGTPAARWGGDLLSERVNIRPTMRAAEDEPEPLFRRANMTNLSRSLLVALIVSYCALVGVDIKLPFVLIAGLYGLLMIMSFFSVRIEGVLFASSSAKLNRRLAVFALGVVLLFAAWGFANVPVG